MAGAMRKMAVYLGLMEDDVDRYDGEYGEHDEFVDDRRDEYRGERPPGNVATMPDRRSVVQAVPTQLGGSTYRITTVHPRTYNEARTIGEHFRDGTPVIMNLTEMHDTDAKRLVDFAAGLIFGLHGTIERVTNKVFLLSPANVDVTAEDKRRIAEGGFFNQS
ncbi:MAG TPA: cell division protein SepF [Actinomycetes bacterium]|nr:cell division protein SepF [Actinomycetes bacterium]